MTRKKTPGSQSHAAQLGQGNSETTIEKKRCSGWSFYGNRDRMYLDQALERRVCCVSDRTIRSGMNQHHFSLPNPQSQPTINLT